MGYLSFDKAMKERFGGKVYRLSLSAGCTCPNRDGSKGTGGCIFCSEGGSGDFASSSSFSLDEQIESAKKLVSAKLSSNFAGYVAYFQSFTNTYGDCDRLLKIFSEAASHDDILAVSIATRPDCISPKMLTELAELNKIKPVWIELGLQTVHDETAKLINRCYKTAVYDDAVRRLKEAGLEVIVHVIIGLPGESHEMIKETVAHVAAQRVDGIKLQLLHVLEGTKLGEMWKKDPSVVEEFTLESYASFLRELLDMIPEDMVVHRLTGDAPKKLLLAPLWTADKKRVLNTIKAGTTDNFLPSLYVYFSSKKRFQE